MRKDGEKTPINTGTDVINTGFAKVQCMKPRKKKSKPDPNFQITVGKKITKKGNNIQKIVDGDRLYIPFKFSKKTRPIFVD